MPRKPMPTKILQLRGSRYAKKRQNEVKPPAADIAAPDWLSERARQHWESTAPQLIASGLLTELDRPAWSMACTLWARAMDLSELIARDGMVLPAADGGSRMHPALRHERQAFAGYLKIAGDFGATPRGRVGLQGQTTKIDELEQFLVNKRPKSKSRFFRQPEPGA